MNNLREIWGSRFLHYIMEVQRYMKYVFTGHLVLVLVFALGAAGYTYSEWLKTVSTDFPASLLVAIVVGMALSYSPPTMLLKPADTVYFLPMETKLQTYTKQGLRWTTFSQMLLPIILYIVALPLLAATNHSSKMSLIWLAIFIAVLKWLFVETEFYFRYAKSGEGLWMDRFVRFFFAALFIYMWLSPYPYVIIVISIAVGFYNLYWRKKKDEKPFPYDHFIPLEQNRMMRFYRFANYFTDVPHLKGSVSRRSWLSPFLTPPKFGSTSTQSYLIRRTFIRTDDLFWLWIRLTLVSIVGALFIPFPYVVLIFAAALSFATAIQLMNALHAGDEFRMDMLFPENPQSRLNAIRKNVRGLQFIQALVVAISTLYLFGFSWTPFLVFIVIVLVSEITIRLTKEKSSV